MTTITFLVCLMYLWCSHHSWSVSYLLCFTTAYLLSYTFNNLLTHLFKAYSDHTFRYITSLSYVTSCSSICTSWIAISSSCPPLACTNALLWPFQCAVWPFVALLQYEAWSGICVATIYDSSPCRDCRPAAPPHTSATDIIASAPMLHTLLNAALSCATKRAYRRAISSYANFCRFHFPVVPVFPASACVLGAFIAHLPSQR